MKAAISNVDIAKHLSLAHSYVSRLRAGERVPSIKIMMKIEMWLKWAIGDQAVCREGGTYATALEEKLVEKFGEAANDDATA